MNFTLPNSKESLKVNLGLIKRASLFDPAELTNLLRKKKEKSLSRKELAYIKSTFCSVEHGFDDLYLLKLAVGDLLLNSESKSEALVRELHWSNELSRTFGRAGVDEVIDYDIDLIREDLKSLGTSIVREAVCEIRARLALLEVLCLLNFEELVFDLISITPRYLSCPIIIRWIERSKYNWVTRSESVGQAEKNLKGVHKVLKVDLRKIKTKKIYEWTSYAYLGGLLSHIKLFRARHGEKCLDKIAFDMFSSYWKIPETYRGALLDGSLSGLEIAKGIMLENGAIDSVVSFRDVLTKLNKLVSKHGEITFLPVVGRLVDTLSSEPRFIYNPLLWDYFKNKPQ